MEIIKRPIKVGNSIAVLIPKKYKDSTVSIKIFDPSPVSESYEILSKNNLLGDVLGIYLTGSYARGDYDFESDIDILVVTNSIKTVIKEGKYELICIPKKEIINLKEGDIIIKIMLHEAKTILNNSLLKELQKIKITKKEKQEFLSKTKQLIKKMKSYLKDINIDYEGTQELIIYSTILRLRSLIYLDGKYSKELIINKVSKELYEDYCSIRKNKKINKKIPIFKLNFLIKLLEEEIKK